MQPTITRRPTTAKNDGQLTIVLKLRGREKKEWREGLREAARSSKFNYICKLRFSTASAASCMASESVGWA